METGLFVDDVRWEGRNEKIAELESYTTQPGTLTDPCQDTWRPELWARRLFAQVSVLSSGVAGKYGNPQRHWSPVKLKSAPNVKIPSYTGKNWVKHFIFENGVIPSLTVFVPPISVLFMWVSYSVHLPYSSCTHSTLDGVQRVGGGKNLYKKCIELYKPLW